MAAEVSWPVCAGVRPVARAPDVAGVDAVCLGGGIAHGLERVAPVAEVPRPVGQGLELPGLHLCAVLCALQVPQLGDDAVDGAVEAGDLAVQRVHEAPQQRLALVGHLRPVYGDAIHDHTDRFRQRIQGVVVVPDVAAVELAALRASTVKREALADGGGGRCGLGVDMSVEHDALLLFILRDPVPRRDIHFGHARAGEPRGVGGAWRRCGASGAGARPYRSLGLRLRRP